MSDQMPPLGPPYGPAGPPPPARYPEHPPTQWGPRPIEPLAEPPPAPTSGSRAALAVVGGIVVAILLVVTAVAVANRDDGSPAATRPRRTTTTQPEASTGSNGATDSSDSTDSPSSVPQDLEQVVSDIKRFVEQQRGLTFKSDVPVELLGDDAFNADLLKGFEEDVAQTRETEQVLKALGLVPANRDLVADMKELLSIGVLGFYDQKTKRLVVRGTDTSPLVRQILAHELTHALDDQWFDLDRPQLDTADDESGFGFDSLVEGSARVVENAYHDEVLTAAERRSADDEQLEITASSPQIFSLPVVLLALLTIPYDAGTELVTKLDEVSATRLNDAFAAPPQTSEQVLEPAKFLAEEKAVAVAPPEVPAGKRESNRGVLGVLLLQQLLDDGLSVDSTSVAPALVGWGGDTYVTWVDGDRTCIADTIVGDDAATTGKLLQALQDWAAGPGVNATVAPVTLDAGSPFTLTSCST